MKPELRPASATIAQWFIKRNNPGDPDDEAPDTSQESTAPIGADHQTQLILDRLDALATEQAALRALMESRSDVAQ